MSSPSSPPPPGPNRLQAVAKYSGLAFQMLAIIGGATWVGTWLDGHFHTQNPWFTIGLALLGVFVAMFQVIRSLTKGAE
ncbi:MULTISPECIES: AtpZ/AtpI family protein [Hymenobacter]|uniref:AtpZ/AtpI family protein n=1 Tax=Hymenobacter armeniacus TaxID=2771358 RepID=A0ABR8JXT7_9BACT|nr:MULTISPECIES: AtpZ/AtpI family protein [Hymenobacter]MBD2723716.1 AtpZ/AtpI family protein [Hymenobacter armeniacus]MBJ6107792.1 AtpZ/AtpI family protein [Hymenobacter sp. BT523]